MNDWNTYMRKYRKQMTPEQKELAREYKQKYRDNNKSIINQKNLDSYKENPEIQTNRQVKSANNNPERTLLKGAKYSALRRGLEFNLELEDIVIPDVCPYLGYSLKVIRGVGYRQEAPSVDRIDPTKGYVKGNIKIISKKANLMKNNASREELVNFAKRVLGYDE